MAFPTTLPSYTITSGSETLNTAGGGTGLSGLLNAYEIDITAIGTKLGTGASTPAANQILISNGAGTSTWQGLTSAQLASVVSDETGTGSLVFSSSPTIVTPTIASFTNANHDHSNAAGGGSLGTVTATSLTTNTIAASGANHISLTAGTSKLVKTSVLRQDDTTNTYQAGNSVTLTGWGVLAVNTGASSYAETVTFGVTFSQRPIVVITSGGDALTASGSAYGTGNNTIAANILTKAYAITTSSFTAFVGSGNNTNFGANGFAWYQWIAIGEI